MYFDRRFNDVNISQSPFVDRNVPNFEFAEESVYDETIELSEIESPYFNINKDFITQQQKPTYDTNPIGSQDFEVPDLCVSKYDSREVFLEHSVMPLVSTSTQLSEVCFNNFEFDNIHTDATINVGIQPFNLSTDVDVSGKESSRFSSPSSIVCSNVSNNTNWIEPNYIVIFPPLLKKFINKCFKQNLLLTVYSQIVNFSENSHQIIIRNCNDKFCFLRTLLHMFRFKILYDKRYRLFFNFMLKFSRFIQFTNDFSKNIRYLRRLTLFSNPMALPLNQFQLQCPIALIQKRKIPILNEMAIPQKRIKHVDSTAKMVNISVIEHRLLSTTILFEICNPFHRKRKLANVHSSKKRLKRMYGNSESPNIHARVNNRLALKSASINRLSSSYVCNFHRDCNDDFELSPGDFVEDGDFYNLNWNNYVNEDFEEVTPECEESLNSECLRNNSQAENIACTSNFFLSPTGQQLNYTDLGLLASPENNSCNVQLDFHSQISKLVRFCDNKYSDNSSYIDEHLIEVHSPIDIDCNLQNDFLSKITSKNYIFDNEDLFECSGCVNKLIIEHASPFECNYSVENDVVKLIIDQLWNMILTALDQENFETSACISKYQTLGISQDQKHLSSYTENTLIVQCDSMDCNSEYIPCSNEEPSTSNLIIKHSPLHLDNTYFQDNDISVVKVNNQNKFDGTKFDTEREICESNILTCNSKKVDDLSNFHSKQTFSRFCNSPVNNQYWNLFTVNQATIYNHSDSDSLLEPGQLSSSSNFTWENNQNDYNIYSKECGNKLRLGLSKRIHGLKSLHPYIRNSEE